MWSTWLSLWLTPKLLNLRFQGRSKKDIIALEQKLKQSTEHCLAAQTKINELQEKVNNHEDKQETLNTLLIQYADMKAEVSKSPILFLRIYS